MQPTGCTGGTWPSSHHPVGTGAQKTRQNDDTLDSAIAVSNQLSSLSDPGVSRLLPAVMKPWPSSQVSLQGRQSSDSSQFLIFSGSHSDTKCSWKMIQAGGEREGTESQLKTICRKAWRWWRARKWRTRSVQCPGSRKRDEEMEREEASGRGRGVSHVKQETLS